MHPADEECKQGPMQPPEAAETVGKPVGKPVFRVDDLVVDTGRVTVTRAGRDIVLPRLSFDLLIALIEAAPRVVSQDELMDRVWPGLVVGPETVSQRVKLLRDSLGDDPKSPRYVAGVRGRGYRLLPAVARLRDATSGEVVESTVARAGRGGQRALWLAGVALVTVAATAAWYALERESAPPATEEAALPARSVAVLAFANSGGGAGSAVLAEGIPETVLHQLSRVPGLTVIARSSSFAFQDEREDLRAIGRKLNVRYLLEGSVQVAGSRLRVTSSLVDAATGTSVWSMQFDRTPQDVFAVQDEIALEVARAMQSTLDTAAGSVALREHGGTGDYEAYLAFLRGRALLENQRVADLPAAVESLTAAVQHDAGFAAAHVLLGRAKIAVAERKPAGERPGALARAVSEALALLNRAIALDAKGGDAWVERGYAKAYYDAAAADADMRRGIELSPNYARGYEGLAAVQFQSVPRRREALELLEKARRLDPLEPRLDVLKALYLYWGPGDSEQSIRILRAVHERNPLYVPALVRLGEVLLNPGGAFAESLLMSEQAVALDPGNEIAWRQAGLAYLELGDFAAAEDAFGHVSSDPTQGPLALGLARRDWSKAGDAAFAMFAAGTVAPADERRVVLALRMQARASGRYDRAIAALEEWAAVRWEDGEPVLEGQLDLGYAVAGLGDMLMRAGRPAEARALLDALLLDLDLQTGRYGRGEIWCNGARARAYMLLDRPDDAMAALKRQAELGMLTHEFKFDLEVEPLFDPLRSRADYRALSRDIQAVRGRELEKFRQMRADGLLPKRPAVKS